MNDHAQRSARPQVALLIVDLQRGMQRDDLPPRNNPGAEARIVELLAAWRAAGWPVVHVRHISRQPGSPFAPGQPGVEMPVVEHLVRRAKASGKLRLADIAELNPQLDSDQRTARIAARLVDSLVN